jgi:hypothetical protein
MDGGIAQSGGNTIHLHSEVTGIDAARNIDREYQGQIDCGQGCGVCHDGG